MKYSFRHALTIFTLVSAASVANIATAEPKCTDEPQDKWQSAEIFQETLKKQGYKIERFLVTEGNCYEMGGQDKDGKKVEIYFNPVDGTVIQSNQEK